MANKDYYGTLGLTKTASADEIKSAYRKLAKQYHPDVFATADAKSKANAEAKFKEIQHAYDVLSDPNKKSTYDQFGTDDPQQSFGGNPFGGFRNSGFGGGFEDIISNIFESFGGGGRRTASAARDGDDIEIQLTLSFEEAAFGIEKELTYMRYEKCATCNGSGAKDASSVKTCTKCGGRGRVYVKQNTMFGMVQTEAVCDQCNGTGRIVTAPCPDCKGKGIAQRQKRISVKIPAGVDNGQILTLRNEGNAGTKGGGNGSLMILFKIKEHPLFVRDGVMLKLELPISIVQAILGDTFEIPTLYGMEKLAVPAGTVDGTVLRIRGKGIKSLRSNTYGDILVRIVIDIPKHLSLRERKAIEEFGQTLGGLRHEKIDRFKQAVKNM